MSIEEQIELAFRAGFSAGYVQGLRCPERLDRDESWQEYKRTHFGTQNINWSFAEAMERLR